MTSSEHEEKAKKIADAAERKSSLDSLTYKKQGKITNAQIESLIEPCRGNMAKIGRRLGVTREAIRQRVDKSDKLSSLVANAKAVLVEDIEDCLHEKALDGDLTAIIFFLKTQAGYVETNRNEHTGKDGQPIEHKLYSVVAPDDWDDGEV